MGPLRPAALPAALWGLRELLGPGRLCTSAGAVAQRQGSGWGWGALPGVPGPASGALCSAAGERDPDHGAPQLLLPVLPAPGDAAGPRVPAAHLPYPRRLRQLPGPRAQGGGSPTAARAGRWPPPLPEAAAQLTLTSDLGGAPGLDTALARLSGLLVARETREAVLGVAGMGRGAGHAGRRGRGPRPQEELQGRSEVECTEPRTRAERWGVAVRGGRAPASFLPGAGGPCHKGTPQPEAAWPVLAGAASRLSQHCGAHSGRRPKSLPTRPGRQLLAPDRLPAVVRVPCDRRGASFAHFL